MTAFFLLGTALAVALLLLTLVFRGILRHNSRRLLENPQATSAKKHPEVQLRTFLGPVRMLALGVSLALVLAAFEWKVVEELPIITGEIVDNSKKMEEAFPPVKLPLPKPPPPPKNTSLTKIDLVDELPPQEVIEVKAIPTPPSTANTDNYTDDPVVVDDIEVLPEEKTDKPFVVVEVSAKPQGGMDEFYRFLSKKIKFPRQAKKLGISGKVYVSFIIERDGSLTDLKVVKGIGAGCDEEVLRVLKLVPNWEPARQRGNVVRQRMVVPVDFNLR
jgi:protein TonB